MLFLPEFRASCRALWRVTNNFADRNARAFYWLFDGESRGRIVWHVYAVSAWQIFSGTYFGSGGYKFEHRVAVVSSANRILLRGSILRGLRRDKFQTIKLNGEMWFKMRDRYIVLMVLDIFNNWIYFQVKTVFYGRKNLVVKYW